jgi:hypothetical protein
VHDYYSVNRFRAAYGREIEPLLDKTQWPQVELPFVVGAPLAKLPVGRMVKNDTTPTDGKGKKKIRGPMTCLRCGQKGHRQASAKCPLNGTKKR